MDQTSKSPGNSAPADKDQPTTASPTALDGILMSIKRREIRGFQSSI
jgi:hypothetical protein